MDSYKKNCNCDKNECNNDPKTFCSINPYSWDMIPYPYEYLSPQPEEEQAKTWPTCFLRKEGNYFYGCDDKPLAFPIKEPDLIFNFKKEFKYLLNIADSLTKEEIEIAKYWSVGPPVKQFLPILDILIMTYKIPACRSQRICYILNAALNDACTICWHYKYTYNVIRPVQYNPLFKTVVPTPKHPTYPAGHSVLAGCVAAVLSYFFPTEKEKLYKLALECSISRLYAGVHFKPDCTEGFKLGEFIGNEVIQIACKDINGNHAKIDYQCNEFKDAPIIPDRSKQYI